MVVCNHRVFVRTESFHGYGASHSAWDLVVNAGENYYSAGIYLVSHISRAIQEM